MSLIELPGDIWDPCWEQDAGSPVLRIVPTNGSRNRFGQAVMGRGIAKQAQARHPDLRTRLGLAIREKGNCVFVWGAYGLITFPVKHNWDQKAVLELIEDSCVQLREFVLDFELDPGVPILMPRVGCGNGHRDWESEVRPILERELEPIAEKIVVVYTEEFEGL